MTTPGSARTGSFKLSPQQVEHYREQGYVIVPGLLSAEEVEALKSRARAIVTGEPPKDLKRLIVRDVRVAKGKVQVDDPELGMWKLFDPDRFDEYFRRYPATDSILDVCESLVGPDLMAFLVMMIYKPPRMEEAVHHYHQDALYFPFGPHDDVLGSWVALDRTDRDNGTLRVIPGSHKGELHQHKKPEGDVNLGIFGVPGYDDDPNEVVVELEPGDGIFFHSRLLHKTGGNKTDRHRRVMTVHYASARCQWTTPEPPKTHFNMRLVRGQRHEGCV